MYGIRIRNLRKQRGMTQQKLANLLYVDNTTISVWELEKAEPSILQIVKMANLFATSTDFLLGKE